MQINTFSGVNTDAELRDKVWELLCDKVAETVTRKDVAEIVVSLGYSEKSGEIYAQRYVKHWLSEKGGGLIAVTPRKFRYHGPADD